MIGTPGYTLFISTENKSSRGELEFDTGLGICWLSALHNYFIPKMMLKMLFFFHIYNNFLFLLKSLCRLRAIGINSVE